MSIGTTIMASWSINPDEVFRFDSDFFIALFYLIIMIAIYSIAVYHFYRYIARRDCFKPSKRKHSTAIGFLKYFFLYPFVAIVFFIGFSIIFIAITKGETYEIVDIFSISFAVILAIRICAYYTEDLSKDVAKMLPFAILGIFLVDATYFQINVVFDRISTLPEYLNSIVQFLILIILVEWILRVALFIRYKIKPKKEEPVAVEAINS
jgi:hypothetical protein